MERREFYVYIMSNAHNRVLYIDVTRDLQLRVAQHKAGTFGGFTQIHNLHKLLYYELWETADLASKRARQLKHWHRDWKINLIKELNPDLADLSTS